MSLSQTPDAGAMRDIYSVSRLNREAKVLLEGNFPLIWLEGELSNLARPASGHLYFSLKDEQCQIRCAFFRQHQRRLTAPLRDGMHVLVRARVSLYEGRGDFQLIIEYLEDSGEGALKRAFEALRARLAAEGLFDGARKRPVPALPRRLGVITSPSGAVIHDILTTLRRRFPAIPVLLYPVPVQGEGAAERIAAAIDLAGRSGECDALIVARGGGSIEDLWAFNEETVARAIHRCPLPVVTAIGHEVDFTIADFVADARAPTPTAAAEMLSPHWEQWYARYAEHARRLQRALRARLLASNQRVDWLAARLIHPRSRLEQLHARLAALDHRLRLAPPSRLTVQRMRLLGLDSRLRNNSPLPRLRHHMLHARHLHSRLAHAAVQCVAHQHERLQHAGGRLNTLSPLATLARGYAIVSDTAGTVQRDARRVSPGTRLHVRLTRGSLACRVEEQLED